MKYILKWLKRFFLETHRYHPGEMVQVLDLGGWRPALYLRESTPKHWHLLKYDGNVHLVHLEDIRP